MKILFVCLGNICRSPLAEGILRHYDLKYGLGIQVDSAGTSGWHNGEAPCEGSINIARKYGMDISSLKSRKVSLYQDNDCDLIVGMDGGNVADLKEMGFDNVVKMGKFGLNNADVPDPYYYKNTDGFEKVYQMINTGIKNIIQEYCKVTIPFNQ